MSFSLRLAPSPTSLAPTTGVFSSTTKQCRIPYSGITTTKIGFSSSLDYGKREESSVLRCSLETASAVVGQVTEVDKDTFWPIVKDAGEKIVVLDMYTQWCGPCKVIAPKYKALSEKYDDVVFLKLDCKPDNRTLAKELGIRVVPTFKIFKDSKVVKEVTGAKYDDLVAAIETARSIGSG